MAAAQVPPDKQFLMGVYRPGQDADLPKKDLKDGQILLMLGDPKPIPLSVGRAPEGARVRPPPLLPSSASVGLTDRFHTKS